MGHRTRPGEGQYRSDHLDVGTGNKHLSCAVEDMDQQPDRSSGMLGADHGRTQQLGSRGEGLSFAYGRHPLLEHIRGEVEDSTSDQNRRHWRNREEAGQIADKSCMDGQKIRKIVLCLPQEPHHLCSHPL